MTTSWYDLPADERAAAMEAAEDYHGSSWYDLDGETRGREMDRAERRFGGWGEDE